jgi:hypothetical protein
MPIAIAAPAPAPRRRKRGFCFAELNPEAQETARQWFREVCEWDSTDSDRLTEQFQQDLESEYGMGGMTVWWSLSSCQGDGVAFKGEPNIEEMATACADGKGWHAAACQQLRRLIDAAKVTAFLAGCQDDPEWRVVIAHEGRYYGWQSMNVNVYCESAWGDIEACQSTLDDLAGLAAEAVCEICSDACEVLETQGYAEIEYHQTDEWIAQECDANEWRFRRDGRPIET